MALKGTLKDFGIADILQLIGQQQKTGTLHVKNKDQAIDVAFQDGNIVRAESAKRDKKDLIGTMLVRADIISDGQLATALEVQKRTLQKLGDLLIDQQVISEQRLKDMVQLQATETLFRLFAWKSGNYEFEQGAVEADALLTPLRAESVLMEGFRMVDEWPVVRKKIPHLEVTFERVKELHHPAVAAPKRDDFDSALDDAMGGLSPPAGDDDGQGEFERKVFSLVKPDRTAGKIVDLSGFGEFETCKVLAKLCDDGFLRMVEPAGKRSSGPSPLARVASVFARIAMAVVVFVGVFFIVSSLDFSGMRFGGASATTYTDPAAQRVASRTQMARLQTALRVYHVEKGSWPTSLDELVDLGLIRKDDVNYPWRDPYYYRPVEAGSFVLLPPLR